MEGLGHDCIFGWDFLQLNRAVLDCSDVSGQFKLKLQKPIRVPPRSVSCVCVKTNCVLSSDACYVLTGQRSGDIEITDSLVRPYTARQIPLTIRNRSDRFVTLRRRDVVGYLQPLDGAGVTESVAFSDEDEHEINAVSSSDNQFLGLSTEEVLDKFKVGSEFTGPAREKLGSLLQSFPDVFSTSYADIGCYQGGDVELELEPGTRPKFSKPYPVPLAKEQPLRDQLGKLQASAAG